MVEPIGQREPESYSVPLVCLKRGGGWCDSDSESFSELFAGNDRLIIFLIMFLPEGGQKEALDS